MPMPRSMSALVAGAISVAETPAHGGEPLFVFENGEDENRRG